MQAEPSHRPPLPSIRHPNECRMPVYPTGEERLATTYASRTVSGALSPFYHLRSRPRERVRRLLLRLRSDGATASPQIKEPPKRPFFAQTPCISGSGRLSFSDDPLSSIGSEYAISSKPRRQYRWNARPKVTEPLFVRWSAYGHSDRLFPAIAAFFPL
jgi:hypothetical protein